MSAFTDRMVRAAKLDAALYEEVEGDESALGQAAGVVVLSSVAAGIGGMGEFGGAGGLVGLIGGTVIALLGWCVWAYLTYLIGTRLLPEPQTKADLGEMLRATGFSSAPGIVRVVGIVPGLAAIAFIATGIWMLVAMVIAVRQVLDYKSTGRAVGVCVIGFVVQVVVMAVILAILGPGAMPRG